MRILRPSIDMHRLCTGAPEQLEPGTNPQGPTPACADSALLTGSEQTAQNKTKPKKGLGHELDEQWAKNQPYIDTLVGEHICFPGCSAVMAQLDGAGPDQQWQISPVGVMLVPESALEKVLNAKCPTCGEDETGCCGATQPFRTDWSWLET